jgi:hypothetical protein
MDSAAQAIRDIVRRTDLTTLGGCGVLNFLFLQRLRGVDELDSNFRVGSPCDSTPSSKALVEHKQELLWQCPWITNRDASTRFRHIPHGAFQWRAQSCCQVNDARDGPPQMLALFVVHCSLAEVRG